MTGMRSLVVRTSGPEETRAVGLALGRCLSGRVTLSLEGPLGSGKSVLARGVCEAAGVEGPVTSPTFTLLNEYVGTGGRRVIHADCFRLCSPEEFRRLGVEDRLTDDALLVVEWGERAIAALGADVVRVELEPGVGDERRIVIRVPEGVRIEGFEGVGASRRGG
jgi:tRNA threonylcarbamoyladenosine biosynthesis protein TsaE